MRSCVLAFVGLASAAAVPRQSDSQYGFWDVSLVTTSAANGYRSRTLTATYNNDDLEAPITSECEYTFNPNATPIESESCDNDAFSYIIETGDYKLSQNVQLYGETVTVMGAGAVSTTCGGANGRVCKGEATIEVTSAIA